MNAASHLRSVAMKPRGDDAAEKKAFGRPFQRIAYVFRPSYPSASCNCDKAFPSRRFSLPNADTAAERVFVWPFNVILALNTGQYKIKRDEEAQRPGWSVDES